MCWHELSEISRSKETFIPRKLVKVSPGCSSALCAAVRPFLGEHARSRGTSRASQITQTAQSIILARKLPKMVKSEPLTRSSVGEAASANPIVGGNQRGRWLCSFVLCRSSRSVLSVLGSSGIVAAAVPAGETLYPNSTKAYFSVANAPELTANWEKTQLHQLFEDPVMKPFTEDLRKQLEDKWLSNHQKIGLSVDDLRGIASGELSGALVGTAAGRTAIRAGRRDR